MSFWQRVGRAGRSSPGLVVFVPEISNPMDYYFAMHPLALLGKQMEKVSFEPNFTPLLRRHLLCAAYESGIFDKNVKRFEKSTRSFNTYFRIFGDSAEAIISDLEKSQEIFSVTVEGEILWKFNKKLGQPHREVSIRGKGGTFFASTKQSEFAGSFFACALTSWLNQRLTYFS